MVLFLLSLAWTFIREKSKVVGNEKQTKKSMCFLILTYIEYSNFWSILIEQSSECKLLISEECVGREEKQGMLLLGSGMGKLWPKQS